LIIVSGSIVAVIGMAIYTWSRTSNPNGRDAEIPSSADPSTAAVPSQSSAANAAPTLSTTQAPAPGPQPDTVPSSKTSATPAATPTTPSSSPTSTHGNQPVSTPTCKSNGARCDGGYECCSEHCDNGRCTN